MSEVKLFTDPRIELVGRPKMDVAAVHKFLEEHELEWPELEEQLLSAFDLDGRDAEWLIEEAGRGCYVSWPKKGEESRGRSHDDHIKHLIEVQHGCYDAETEVLTEHGWKKFADVKLSDRVATINNVGQIKYHKPINQICADYSGRMYRVQTTSVDLLVTPNHKMFVKVRDEDNFKLVRADELNDCRHRYKKNGFWYAKSKFKDRNIHDWMTLLGFAIGDGYIENNRLRFKLTKPRKIKFMDMLCSFLQLDKNSEVNGSYNLAIPKDKMDLFRSIYNNNDEKIVPNSLIMECSELELVSLYAGLMESDGCVSSNHSEYFTTSPILANQVQQLCLHIGLAANIRIQSDRSGSFGNKPLYIVHVFTTRLQPQVNTHENRDNKTSWVSQYSGQVYCLEVPNNTLYVRRNGKAVWCGNSVLEHVNFNFHVWGISRSCSHEIVRHRAGFAYSQLSQRYVDSSSCAFVVPPAIQELKDSKSDIYDMWLRSCERSQKLYGILTVELAEMYKDIKSRTERRKKARQAARSVLPNATETKIFITCNGRALRHFCEMRANPAADLEIRKLAVAMFDIMSEKFPLIVHGMKKVELEDGTFGVESEFRKV